MPKKMLIDATHPEETRVVVVDGQKVEEFDFESESKRQLTGNIYLAKVTRVEPSLQAAFIEYGGNRHGFLAFAEIHPDYYQIPVADREALIAEEEAEAARAEEDARGAEARQGARRSGHDDDDDGRGDEPDDADEPDEPETLDGDASGDDAEAAPEDADLDRESGTSAVGTAVAEAAAAEATIAAEVEPEIRGMETSGDGEGEDAGLIEDTPETSRRSGRGRRRGDRARASEGASDGAAADGASDDDIEGADGDDDVAGITRRPRARPRRYKIQEVVKVRQILLVQVVKEERGNKGAALTTYLSLAGRYCVLMPNTARGGGISRKITQAADRKKLKEIAQEIEVPRGAGLIIRTAGAKRTKPEIKRDYEYLQRLWEQVRELTLKSVAPAKIYEEGDLIKRTIRDLYNRDIEEVLVEGEAGYRTARDFMAMIMPSHARNVRLHEDGMPLFARHGVETTLGAMFNPTVQLPSGGYIVIGVTEALVAIDVNSGRATKKGSIEETALQTNLEAAEEVARQVKLRDLAGLIVIDFIDMDDRRNNAAVEKRLKERLKTDRARIQLSRISGFGLLEMSRQRMRPGMIEATTQACSRCHGTGLIRSDDSLALTLLRQIEEEGTRRRSAEVLVRAPVGAVNYLFNHKRESLAQIEARFDMAVRLEADAGLVSPDFALDRFKTRTRSIEPARAATPVVSGNASLMEDLDAEAVEAEERLAADAEVEAEARDDEGQIEARSEPSDEGEDDGAPRKKRRRRRRRRSGSGEGEAHQEARHEAGDEARDVDAGPPSVQAEDAEAAVPGAPDEEASSSKSAVEAPAEAGGRTVKRRRRTRTTAAPAAQPEAPVPAAQPASAEAAVAAPPEPAALEEVPEEAADGPLETKSAHLAPPEEDLPEREPEPTAAAPTEPPAPEAAARPAATNGASEPEPQPEPEPQSEPEPAAPAKAKRRGWWSLGR